MRFLLILFLLFSFLKAEFVNRLIYEDSPYLQQHAHNPVKWYPWGDEALLKAKKEKKMIFLSIGYSTCHWCHIMARESFENENIAKLLNKDFISIKVDREELPHFDKYYQKLHFLLKKHSGGWPLTAVLSEDVKPFFIAIYLPPTKMYGHDGLDVILPSLALEYKNNKNKIVLKSKEIEKMMRDYDRVTLAPVKTDINITKDIYNDFEKHFDDLYYGFSLRPKFPESSKIALLFNLHNLGIDGSKNMALKTLRVMALHGLYDQVERGFFRYSVDEAWEIPHFEKMLYTMPN